ncbi:hypothetical protein RB601_008596 [Gaeumannomyces tritici]
MWRSPICGKCSKASLPPSTSGRVACLGHGRTYRDRMTSSARGHTDPSRDDIATHSHQGGAVSLASRQTAASPAREVVDENTEITHLYLTFDTPLPIPDTTPRQDDQTTPTAPAPDLTRFADPLLWPRGRKNLMLFLSCVATLLTAYTAGSYAPPARGMAADLHNEGTGAASTTHLAALAGITTFCFGFALAPMVLAPLSEVGGRYPVFAASGVVFVASQAACGAARSLAAMLAARLLTGVGGSVFSTMVGGVIADMWRAEERNTPMALFSGAVLVGTGLGPMAGAEIAGGGARGAWRWVFWHQVIAAGVLMVALIVLFKESRGSILLSRKARALNKWYEEMEQQGYYGVWVEDAPTLRCGGGGQDSDLEAGTPDKTAESADEKAVSRRESVATSTSLQRIRWKVKSDEERASIGKVISISVSRPFHLLFTEPVVFFFSLWVSFAWGVLYLTFGGIPLVFEVVYGWRIRQAGYVFGAMIVGSVVATAVSILQERLLHHRNWDANSDVDTATLSPVWLFLRRRLPTDVPESRLYFTCLSATLLPVGLFLFGLASRPDSHWMVPTVGVGVATVGIFSVYLATFNYLADVYQTYASSALAAQSCCRNILGGIFPLVTGTLFQNLGPANAGIVLGSIAVVLTLVPWVLVLYGERIRARSRFAVALDSKI